jgi:hypothetical protein
MGKHTKPFPPSVSVTRALLTLPIYDELRIQELKKWIL